MRQNSLFLVNGLVREMGNTAWLVGHNIIVTLKSEPGEGPYWSDGKGSFFTISKTSNPITHTQPLADSSHIEKVYDAGGVSAVWSFGEAFCKIKIVSPGVTKEHITLEHIKRHHFTLDFKIPDVYYQAEHDGLYFIFLSRVHGMTLANSWPTLDEAAKTRIVSRIVDICTELGKWTGEQISGIDGNCLSDQYLLPRNGPYNFSPENLSRNSEALEMDCSVFMLYHCDLGPGNILVDDKGMLLGIIDWETVGFVPKEWIRTKFRISGGMDLLGDDMLTRTDWRRRVQLELGMQGYPDIAERWIRWFRGEV